MNELEYHKYNDYVNIVSMMTHKFSSMNSFTLLKKYTHIEEKILIKPYYHNGILFKNASILNDC